MKLSTKKKKDENHSRCLEQRVEIVKGRIFCHPVPQLLDNLGYLVVSVPLTEDTNIVAFLVDCGDAPASHNIILDIQDLHYPNQKIELHAILSTHKHHDHTAGNKGMLDDKLFGTTMAHIYGGAVERVPHCTTTVANRDLLDLPKIDRNNMNDHITVEVVAVPGHTRGSVAYVVRSKEDDPVAFCFTGDTMFSGGAGVPFEADVQPKSDASQSNKTTSSYIRASAGTNATERCFAEIMVRALGESMHVEDKVLIFPGHEYTSELVSRQFFPSAGETSHWNKMPPSVFFEIASHFFVSQHRRTLPKDGKLLTIPSPLSRELIINPNLRKMKQRGEDIIKAVQLWHRIFERRDLVTLGPNEATKQRPLDGKTPATDAIWNLGVKDFSRSVFTTVFTSDLEALIDGLATGKFDRDATVKELKNLKTKLDEPLIGRRPIPGTLPSERIRYQAILGFCLLGSPPSAMTISDSRLMNLRPPVNPSKANIILISRTRIVTVLRALGLLQGDEGKHVVEMIRSFWAEVPIKTVGSAAIDTEDICHEDEIDLGTLKWMLYGIEEGYMSSLSFCMPCKPSSKRPIIEHPIHKVASMRKSNGELVRHDILTCLLCRDLTGCPIVRDSMGISNNEIIVTPEAGKHNSAPNGMHHDEPRQKDVTKPLFSTSDWKTTKISESTTNGPIDEVEGVSASASVEVEITKSFP